MSRTGGGKKDGFAAGLFGPPALPASFSGLVLSDPAHERHHHCRHHKAHRNCEVGIGVRLDLRFPIGRLPQFLERCGLAGCRIALREDVVADYWRSGPPNSYAGKGSRAD
jgi:hypothetical protein